MADTAAAPQGDATSRLVKSLQEFGRGMDPAELAAAAHPLALQEAQRLLVNAGDVVAWALRAQRQKATGKLHVARKPRASLVHLLVDAGCPRRGAEKMSYDEAVAMLGGNYFAQMLVDKVRAAALAGVRTHGDLRAHCMCLWPRSPPPPPLLLFLLLLLTTDNMLCGC